MPTSLKRRLRTAVDHVARLSGILSRRERAMRGGLTVLMYHRVLVEERCGNYPFRSLAMPLSDFRQQVRWLAAHGDVLPLAQALEREGAAGPSPRPRFALTFDDGYEDAAEIAAPILEECGLRGTFFVTTGFVGTKDLLWFDRAALLFAAATEGLRREIVLEIGRPSDAGALPRRGSGAAAWAACLKSFRLEERGSILSALEDAAGGAPAVDGFRAMSVGQLVDLYRRDHEIGSHTVTHPILPDLDETELLGEVRGSRTTLAGWLGAQVRGFCYPNGDYDDRVAESVARAGYSYACTTRDGIHRPGDDVFRIRRVDVVHDRVTDSSHHWDATAFRRELCGLYRRSG